MFRTCFLAAALAAVFCPVGSQAQYEAGEYNEVAYFDFNEKLREAYKQALQMRFKESKVALQAELSRNVFNLMPHYIDDYIDFLRVYVGENPAEYERLKQSRDARTAKLSNGDSGSPYFLYTQAEVFLRWAWIESKFGSEASVAKDLKRAFGYAESNYKAFPNFAATRKTLGLLHLLACTLPANLRKTLGVTVSMRTGMEHLKATMEYGQKYPNFEFTEETQLLYVLMLNHLGTEHPDYWKLVNTGLLDHKKSQMAAYAVAQMYLRQGQSAKALLVLESYPKSDQYQQIYLLDYMLGQCRLYKMDYVGALPAFQSFLSKHKGDGFVKSAYQYMAWAALLKGDKEQYTAKMNELLQKGNTKFAVDALAQEEAQSKKPPALALLKAHLYREGGYYDSALKEIQTLQESALASSKEKLWYYHTYALTYHKMKRLDDAVKYYKLTAGLDKSGTDYAACNSILQMGLIYEGRKELEQAKAQYEACLKMNPTYYRPVLHGQAQSQLDLLKG